MADYSKYNNKSKEDKNQSKINQTNFREAVKNSRGIITIIAQRLQTTRKAIYDYLEKSKKARELLEEEREKPFDVAESVVMQKLQENDLKAAEILLLKHKRGRARGYGEKQELEHSTDNDIDINLHQLWKECQNEEQKSNSKTSS